MEIHSLNIVMVETYNQKMKEHSKELLVHGLLNIIFMQLLTGYNAINIGIHDRKKMFPTETVQKHLNNFWQVIVTESFVQIYDKFELREG